ncbi:MAG TPA: hypothetical protein VFI46_00090 [Jiangellaceae bacterium]|nr:hypothetical protein [Jiangellaceae bacterium]
MGRTALGFCNRTGSASAVAIGEDGTNQLAMLGRWDIDLTDNRVLAQVFHAVEGWDLSTAVPHVEKAIKIVRQVAVRRLGELIGGLPDVVAVGVIGRDTDRPIPVAKALTAHPLMHAAEGELYRDALVDAATETPLAVSQIPRWRADELLRDAVIAEIVAGLGAQVGPPWRKEQKRAAVAALTALRAVNFNQDSRS